MLRLGGMMGGQTRPFSRIFSTQGGARSNIGRSTFQALRGESKRTDILEFLDFRRKFCPKIAKKFAIAREFVKKNNFQKSPI